MYKRVDGNRVRAAVGILLVAAAVLVSQNQAAGAEPGYGCPEAGTPILSKIPYLSRLFRNVGVAQEQKCPQDDLERSGVDFECEVDCPFLSFGASGWQVCPLEVQAAYKATPCTNSAATCSGEKSCTANACTGKSCAEKACTVSACAKKCCCDECLCDDCECGERKCELTVAKQQPAHWEQMIGMAAENGALAATLEAHEGNLELIEGMAELMVENAKLEAKLEAQAERLELVSEMQQLLAENSRLKAQAELATERAQLTHGALMTSLENEKLKLRIAELELKAGNEARTAARPRVERKAR